MPDPLALSAATEGGTRPKAFSIPMSRLELTGIISLVLTVIGGLGLLAGLALVAVHSR